MKYMLIMNTPRDGYAQYMKWPRKILEGFARARTGGRSPTASSPSPRSFSRATGSWMSTAPSARSRSPRKRPPRRGPRSTGGDGKPIQHLWIEVRQILNSHKDLG